MSQAKKLYFTVIEQLPKLRLDKYLATILTDQDYGLSREKIKQLIIKGNIIINQQLELSPKRLLNINDHIELLLPELQPANIVATEIPLDIIYEDKDLLVINKQAGLTTHPGAGNIDNTLVNALLAYKPDDLSQIGGIERPGIVHRLDKNTSGLIIVAKNDFAHLALSKQLQERSLKREYIALIWGMLSPDCGTIDLNIARNSKNRKLMQVVVTGGKHAITHYQTEQILCKGLLSLVRCRLETGRTHQIRVHMAHLQHEIFADPEYGKHQQKIQKYLCRENNKLAFSFKRQALHATKISFIQPRSKKIIELEQDLPDDFANLLQELS